MINKTNKTKNVKNVQDAIDEAIFEAEKEIDNGAEPIPFELAMKRFNDSH